MITTSDLNKVTHSKMSFAEALSYLRKQAGLTLRKMAEKAESSSAYLSQLETGKRNPPKPEMLMRISQALSDDTHLAVSIYSLLSSAAGYKIEEELDAIDTAFYKIGRKSKMKWLDDFSKTKKGLEFIDSLVSILQSDDKATTNAFISGVEKLNPTALNTIQGHEKGSKSNALDSLFIEMLNEEQIYGGLETIMKKRREKYFKIYSAIREIK